MVKETLLVVEDDQDIVEIIEYHFAREGYTILSATDGEKGLEIARKEKPAAVILDLMLPGLDGIEVARRLKQDPDTMGIAIVILTAKGEESDIILGLGVGADEYIVKPFNPREVVARVKAVLRRGLLQVAGSTSERLEIHGLVIDKARYQVSLNGVELPLTLTEFKLVAALASAPGRVFTRQLILERIQGESDIDERNIDVHVKSIRKKLGDASDYIATVPGVGYKSKE